MAMRWYKLLCVGTIFVVFVCSPITGVSKCGENECGASTERLALLLKVSEQISSIRSVRELEEYLENNELHETPLLHLSLESSYAIDSFLDSLVFSKTGLASYSNNQLSQIPAKHAIQILRLFGAEHVALSEYNDSLLSPLELAIRKSNRTSDGLMFEDYPDRVCFMTTGTGGCAPQVGNFCNSIHCGLPIPWPWPMPPDLPDPE